MSHRGGGGAKSQGSKTEKKGEGEKREREQFEHSLWSSFGFIRWALVFVPSFSSESSKKARLNSHRSKL